MTVVDTPAISPMPATIPPVPGTGAQAAPTVLPTPLMDAAEPTDALGMFMAMMDEMARTGIQGSTNKVLANKDNLRKAMEEFKAKLEEIAKKAQEKEADDGWGIFGDICDAVCDFVGDVVGEFLGPAVEFLVDTVRAPLDIIVGLCKGENLVQLLEQEAKDLESQGKLSKTVTEAVKGLADLVKDVKNAATGFLEAIASGEDPLSALADYAGDLWNALETNVLENPAVMEVVGTALKVIAIAGAVASGGILGPVAAGLLILSEIDTQTGFINEMCGEEAGPWVSLGIKLTAAVCSGLGSGLLDSGAEAAKSGAQEFVEQLTEIANGIGAVLSIASGVNGIVNAFEQRELGHDLAELKALGNRMAQLQRMIDALLAELEGKSEDHDRIKQGNAKLVELQAQGMEAVVSYKA